jgi:hypothetical protein
MDYSYCFPTQPMSTKSRTNPIDDDEDDVEGLSPADGKKKKLGKKIQKIKNSELLLSRIRILSDRQNGREEAINNPVSA